MSDDEMQRRLDAIHESLVGVEPQKIRKSLTALGSLMMMAGFADNIDDKMHESMKEASISMMCGLSPATANAMMAFLLYMTSRSRGLRDPPPEAIAEANEKFGVDITDVIKDIQAGNFDAAGKIVADMGHHKISEMKKSWDWEKPNVGS